MFTKPYTPNERLARLLAQYNRMVLYVKRSDLVLGIPPNPPDGLIRFGEVICPEGIVVKSVNMVTSDAAAVTVFGHYGVGCVLVVLSAQVLGLPTSVIRVRANGAEVGVSAEWSKNNVPALPEYIKNSPDVKLEEYLSFEKVEADAEAHLNALNSLLNRLRVAI